MVSGGYPYSAGGIAISGGVLDLRGTVIRDNVTPSDGGGIHVTGSVLNVLEGSLITSCFASDGGGVPAEANAVVNISPNSSIPGNISNSTNQPNNCAGPGQFNGTCG